MYIIYKRSDITTFLSTLICFVLSFFDILPSRWLLPLLIRTSLILIHSLSPFVWIRPTLSTGHIFSTRFDFDPSSLSSTPFHFHTFHFPLSSLHSLIQTHCEKGKISRVTSQRIKSDWAVGASIAGKNLGKGDRRWSLKYIWANPTHSLGNHVSLPLPIWTSA